MPELAGPPSASRIALVPALLCAAAALLASELEHVPLYFLDPAFTHAFDIADPTLRGTLWRLAGETLIALLALAFVHVAARRRPALAARPVRLIATIQAGASLGFVLVQATGRFVAPAFAETHLRLLARDWSALMAWCLLFGWIFFLDLRRRDDRTRLAWMRMRRVPLTRQLAQSRLGAARAQIEPGMVAGVLRTVRRHVARDGGLDPVALIDHLALYLRLLLDRVRHGAPTLRSDLALVRSLVALRRVETGLALEVQVDAGVAAVEACPAMATFLVVRAMLDASAQCAPARIRLALQVHGTALRVQVRHDGSGMDAGVRARLAATVAGLQSGAALPDPHVESGMHCHEVLVPLQ